MLILQTGAAAAESKQDSEWDPQLRGKTHLGPEHAAGRKSLLWASLWPFFTPSLAVTGGGLPFGLSGPRTLLSGL